MALLAWWPTTGWSAEQRPIQLADMFKFQRVSDPQISPDGKRIAYVVTNVLKDENRTDADIWVVNADGTGEPKKLVASPKHDRHPRWSPDGKWLAFESAREGTIQIYLLPTDGGEAKKLTHLFTGASQPVWSPDGRYIAFVSSVFPEFSNLPFAEADKANREKQEQRDKSKVKARVIDTLLYRHWDSWVEDKRLHLFVVRLGTNGSADGEPRNVTPGENDAQPTSSTFAEGDEFDFSPDGRELVFTAPPLPIREQAWSTNHDLWSVNIETGKRVRLTENPAADGLPRFSPDGRFLAYRAQERAGAEADRWQLWLLDRQSGTRRSLTANWDYSVDNLVWAADGTALFVEVQEKAEKPLFKIAVADGAVNRIVSGGVNTEVQASMSGEWVAFSRHEFTRPPEIARLSLGQKEPAYVTRTNEALLAQLALSKPESVTVTGAGGAPVQMWILRPPGFEPSKKYPLVFWVHGGPQSAFLNSWSTRWNPQVWAAQGYVVALPNPRGSTGFGQQFTDEISHDWGGKVFEDLLACLQHLEGLPYIDKGRMAAAGASYGGYMMNWFQVKLPGRFKTLVNHCGVYNFESMYGTTEELWFDEWEHGKPWENPDFNKHSPHKYADRFSTPMLIIHNDLDFRVPISEGMQAFTVLQRRGIPSRMVMFPDEGHWVLKPQNSEFWHQTIFDWLKQYLHP
jgi:dipeptidyl aminopeptidase/acylaminoacyl peptidase